jgi:hypothetical protein
MKRLAGCLLPLGFSVVACSSEGPPLERRTQPQVPADAPAAERVFGEKPKLAGPTVQVAEVLKNPEPYLGQTLQCAGVVARVCENAGCWLELRDAPEQSEGLRVPMAGHAFFIPQDVVGRTVTVEGQLSARPLSDAQRRHLESEGLKAIGPLSLSATSVVVR